MTQTVHGGTLYWDANAATAGRTDGAGAWLTASQWWNGSNNVDWTSGDNAIFGNGGTGGAVTLVSPTDVSSLTFNTFSGTYTLGTAGQTLTINSGIAKNVGSGIVNFASNITLGAAQTWTNNSTTSLTNATGARILDNSGFNLTFDGTGSFNMVTSAGNTLAITGAGGIIKNGTGHLTLDSNPTIAHSFTGDIVLNGGSIGFQTASVLSGKTTTLNGGYLGGRSTSGFTWTDGLGTGANQIQITGGTSGFSGEGTANSAFQIGTALSTLTWGNALFNPTVLLANGDARMNAGGKGSLNNTIDLNGTTRTITSLHTTDGAATSGFTISGAIVNTAGSAAGLTKTGVGNLILPAANTYNGATTITSGGLNAANGGGAITLSGAGAINSTTALNLNGTGTLRLVNTAQVDRFADGAPITSNGGTISYENTSGATSYSETFGAITHSSGQLNIVEATNQAGAGSQTLTFSGLIRTGLSALTFSAASTAPQASGNKNLIIVTGAGTTATGQIIGPWATTGTAAAAQTDYAVYNADFVVPAGIAASVESTWTDAGAPYTMANPGGVATTLTDTRNLSALRNTSVTAALAAVSFAGNGAADFITVTGNTFANGDVVTFGGTAPGGLTTGTAYYVVNAGVNGVDTFNVSLTSGGAGIDLTSAGTGPNITGGVKLTSGNNLGTTGLLNAAQSALAIGTSGTGVITLPTTTADALYVTPGNNAAITIGAPVADNTGTGILTLVKSGSATLRLDAVNTYTGSTVIHAGTLQLGTNGTANGAQLGSGSYAGSIFIGAGANLSVQTNANQTFSGVISGSGNLTKSYSGTLTLSGDNNYTGKTAISPLTTAGAGVLSVSSFNSVNGGTPLLASSSLGAPTTVANGTIDFGNGSVQAGGTLRYTGGGETTDRVINFLFNGNGATKVIDASGSGLLKFTSTFTASATATNDITLQGSSNGEIVGGLPFTFRNFTKAGNGTWTLGGPSGHTGTTTVSAGTLILNGDQSAATGAAAINGTSTLGGSGTLGGAVTVAAGASLAPGPSSSSVGTLSIGGSLNLSAPVNGGNGKLRFDLGPIASSDKLVVTGALTIGTDKLGFSDFVFTPLAGLTNGTYQLITTGSITAGNTLDPGNLSGSIGVGTGTLQITGSNIELVVTGLGGLSGYNLWASTNATSTTPEQDQDGDGVSNAVEYLLGGSNLTNDQARLPAISAAGGDLVFTFQRAQVSIDGSTTPVIEVGTDLVNWPSPSPYAIPNVATVNNPGVTVVKDSSPGFDTITLTLPRGLEPKMFARIKVAVTP